MEASLGRCSRRVNRVLRLSECHPINALVVKESLQQAPMRASGQSDWIPDMRPNISAVQRNNVQVFGSGDRTMLFAHGYGCDQNMWRFVAPAFVDEFKVVLFDHVGAGKSDASCFDRTKYRTLDGYAQDVLEICRELDLQNVTFVGHSVSS